MNFKISLKFVPKGPINNILALVRSMAWRRSDDKPLSEPMMASSLTHVCVTRPQRVKDVTILVNWIMSNDRASLPRIIIQHVSPGLMYKYAHSSGQTRHQKASFLMHLWSRFYLAIRTFARLLVSMDGKMIGETTLWMKSLPTYCSIKRFILGMVAEMCIHISCCRKLFLTQYAECVSLVSRPSLWLPINVLTIVLWCQPPIRTTGNTYSTRKRKGRQID